MRQKGIAFLFSIFFSISFGMAVRAATPFPNDERTKKIFTQECLIKEGSDLVEEGRYDQAIAKYKEAAKPELFLHDYDEDRPNLLMAEALEFQSKYEDALLVIDNILKKYPDRKGYDESWDGKKLELNALINARNTKSPEPIYKHIGYLKEKYKNQLPPNAGTYSDVIASSIIRLYDHIGDFEKGAEFVNGFLKRCADGVTCKDNERKLAYTSKHPYFPIRAAFEQDKAEGFKGCVDAKPGGACMGRATKALIQSNHFPW
jgi:tetratricopeptide (TPR) repeat protein